MYRTRRRRRFETDRVIRHRQREYRRVEPEGRPGLVDLGQLDNGRLRNKQAYYACPRARCNLCHPTKRTPGQERARTKRAWLAIEAVAW